MSLLSEEESGDVAAHLAAISEIVGEGMHVTLIVRRAGDAISIKQVLILSDDPDPTGVAQTLKDMPLPEPIHVVIGQLDG
jgi:hypothetical protein